MRPSETTSTHFLVGFFIILLAFHILLIIPRLGMMPEEDDWYFGSALRLEGRDLLKSGSALEDDRRTLEVMMESTNCIIFCTAIPLISQVEFGL